MKDMIQRMTAIDAGKTQLNESAVAECGMPPSAPPMNQGTPVSMNVSLNASGTEHVEDLINMMKNAGMGAAEPVSAKMLSPRMDMERLSSIMGEPDMGPESVEEGAGVEITDELWDKIVARKQELMGPDEDEMEPEDAQDQAAEEMDVDPEELNAWLEAKFDEGYANEPDEAYGDTQLMTKDLSGGLNREKKSYKVVAGGDNPMEYKMEVESIKEALMAALQEKKAKPDFLDVDKDGDKKEPMKKALKDKGSKPKKGEVPPQFKKK